MMKKQGNTYCFDDPPRVLSYASVVGKKEGEGPLSRDFDYISNDNTFGEQTWEKAESRMMSMAFERVLNKGQLPPEQLGCVLGGDLLNQCISTTFALRPTNVPFFGLYGACSTMAEGLVLNARGAPSPLPTFVRQSGNTATRWNTAANGPRLPSGRPRPRARWCCTKGAKGSRSQKPRRAASPTRV